MLPESFIKCSCCAVHVVLLWLTGVSSTEHVTHRQVTSQSAAIHAQRKCSYVWVIGKLVVKRMQLSVERAQTYNVRHHVFFLKALIQNMIASSVVWFCDISLTY